MRTTYFDNSLVLCGQRCSQKTNCQ